jgi:hypothetical protein
LACSQRCEHAPSPKLQLAVQLVDVAAHAESHFSFLGGFDPCEAVSAVVAAPRV